MVIDAVEAGSCVTVFARGVVGDSQRLPSVTRLSRAGSESDLILKMFRSTRHV